MLQCMIFFLLLLLNLKGAVTQDEDFDSEREMDTCRAWNVKNDINASDCHCASNLPLKHVTECDSNYISVDYHSCVTYDISSHAALAGSCPYNTYDVNYHRKLAVHIPNDVKNVNLTTFMCEPLNRTGELCSLCKAGLGPALLNYSHPCLECSSYGWVIYIGATFIPATFFLIVIVIFQIDATSPSLSCFILFGQLHVSYISKNSNILYSAKRYTMYYLTESIFIIFHSLYGLWNLDFFRLIIPSFCISSHMSIYTVLALEYVVAVYPIFFTALIYLTIELHGRGCRVLNTLWKPFHPIFYKFRKNFNIRGSVINAFATFICLSYSKIFFTSINSTSLTKVFSSDNTTKYIMYFNSSIPYSAARNIPYFILGFIMCAVFCIVPLVVLILFHTRACKCLHKYKLLYEVVVVFQKHYKDGRAGTTDCRSFAGVYFACKVLYMLTMTFNITFVQYYGRALIFLLFLLLFSYFQPYKKAKYNILVTLWFLLFTMLTLSFLYNKAFLTTSIVNSIILVAAHVLPLVYVLFLLLYKGLRRVHFKLDCCDLSLTKCWKKSTEQLELPDRLLNPSRYCN